MKKTLLFILSICSYEFILSQEIQLDSNYVEPRLLLHYSLEEINDLKLNDTLNFNTITYYYLYSYKVEMIKCNQCKIFDIQTFDVSIYEEYRKKSKSTVIINQEYGFKLTLFSISDLAYKLKIHERKLKLK